jgi:hypothetical protein
MHRRSWRFGIYINQHCIIWRNHRLGLAFGDLLQQSIPGGISAVALRISNKPVTEIWDVEHLHGVGGDSLIGST